MSNPNRFIHTFLHEYCEKEIRRAETEEIHQWLVGQKRITEKELLARSLSLQVCRKSDRKRKTLGDLVKEDARILLLDRVGTGKRTAARKVFHDYLKPDQVIPEFLPFWLSCDLQSTSFLKIFSEKVNATQAQLTYWLKQGPPLLLFIEREKISNFEVINEFLRKFNTTHCILLQHSTFDQDHLSEQLSDFTTYEMEVLDEERVKNLRDKHYQDLPNENRLTVDEHAKLFRRCLSHGKLLPEFLFLLNSYPSGESASSSRFEVFQKAATEILHKEFENESYPVRSRIWDTLSNIALAAFKMGELKSGLSIPPEASFSRKTTKDILSREDHEFCTESFDKIWDCSPSSVFLTTGDRNDKAEFPNILVQSLFACEKIRAFLNQSSFKKVVNLFAEFTLIAEQVAGDFGESLSLEEFEGLFQATLTFDSRNGYGSPKASRSNLITAIHNICHGAKHDIAQHLKDSSKKRRWRSLTTPSLLQSEIYRLLQDGAASEKSAKEIKQWLAEYNCDWLERIYPRTMPLMPTTDHSAMVTALYVVPSKGETEEIISGDESGRVRIWNVKEGRHREIQRIIEPIRHLNMIKDNNQRWVVFVGEDGAVRLWNMRTGNEAKYLKQPDCSDGRIFALVVLSVTSENEKIPCIVSAGESGKLYVWFPFHSQNPMHTIDAHQGSITHLALIFSTGDPIVTSAGEDGFVKCWQTDGIKRFTNSKECEPLSRASKAPVTALIANQTELVWGDQEGYVSVYWHSIEKPISLHKHSHPVRHLLLSDSQIISTGEDGTVVRSDVHNGEEGEILREGRFEGAIRGLTLGHNPQMLFCVKEDGAVSSRWYHRVPREACSFVGRLCSTCHYDAKPHFVIAVDRVVQLSAFPTQETHEDSRESITCLNIGEDSFLVGRDSGNAQYLSWKDEKSNRDWPIHAEDSVAVIEIQGKHIIIGGRDGKVCVWKKQENHALHLEKVWRTSSLSCLWASERDVVWGSEIGSVFYGRLDDTALNHCQVDTRITALDARTIHGNENVLDILLATEHGQLFRWRTSAEEPEFITGDLTRFRIKEIRWVEGDQFAAITEKNIVSGSVSGSHDSQRKWSPPNGEMTCGTFSRNGKFIAVGTDEGFLYYLDLLNWQPQSEPPPKNLSENLWL